MYEVNATSSYIKIMGCDPTYPLHAEENICEVGRLESQIRRSEEKDNESKESSRGIKKKKTNNTILIELTMINPAN